MAHADNEVSVFEHGADRFTLKERTYVIRDASWCCPFTFASIPASCYDRNVIGQPYDAVKVVAFGKAMRNPVILALAFPVGAFVGAIAGLYAKDGVIGVAAGAVAALFMLFLYFFLRKGSVQMHSRTNFFPVIGGGISFLLGFSADKVMTIAEAFMAQHAKVTGMMWPGLESMTQISTCIVRDGLFCGTYDIYVAGTYVVVFKQLKLFGLCFPSESYEAFPLSQLTFVQYASRGRSIFRFFFLTGLGVAVDMLVSQSVGAFTAIGGVVGLVSWFFSGIQSMVFGVRDGLHVYTRVPYALSNPSQLALDIVKPLFPAEIQHEITNDVEPQAKYEGRLAALPGVQPQAAMGKCSTIGAVLCSAASASMEVYPHHVVTNNSEAVRCCRCLGCVERAIYACMKNLFALGDDTFISILRNVPVVRCQMPGIRNAAFFCIFFTLVGLVVGGAMQEPIVAAIGVGVGLIVGFVLYCGRRSTVYIGEEEWLGTFIHMLGRNFHHIEFAAAGFDADEIVNTITKLQAVSRERSFAIATKA